MSDFLEALNWRYATKKFDKTKKIPEDFLQKLLSAMNLAPSSYGLQPYEILIIEDSELRAELKKVSWNQSQVTDASQLVVICNKLQPSEQDVDDFIKNISETRELPLESLADYSAMMKNTVLNLPQEHLAIWTARQAYIVLGTLLAACAHLQIDACPMEGFDKNEYDRILNLKEKGLEAAVIATIGYRAEDDGFQHLKKVRKTDDELFTRI